MINHIIKMTICVIFSSFILPSIARADFICSGKIYYLGSGNDGTVQVNVGNGVWTICSLSSTYSGVTTTQSCQSWYAMLLSSKMT